MKSYIRDDIDYLNKIRTETNENKVFGTFDISSMYTNLDNDLGLEAINVWLEKDPDDLPRNIPKEFVLDALGIVLECDVFFFNNKYYLQIKGCAMGTKLAPTYATLVMAYLELRLYDKVEEKFVKNLEKNSRSNGVDIWMIVLSTGTQHLQKLQIYTTPSTAYREELSLLWKLTPLKTPFFRSYSL